MKCVFQVKTLFLWSRPISGWQQQTAASTTKGCCMCTKDTALALINSYKLNPQHLKRNAEESDARKLNFGSLSPFGIRSPLSSEMTVLRLQQSKSRTSEPRVLAMLSTCGSLVSGSLFAMYLDT